MPLASKMSCHITPCHTMLCHVTTSVNSARIYAAPFPRRPPHPAPTPHPTPPQGREILQSTVDLVANMGNGLEVR